MVGIRSSIDFSQLEPVVCKVWQHIGVNVIGDEIKLGHYLDKKKQSDNY